MLAIFLLVLGLFAVVFVLVSALLWRTVAGYLEQRKIRQLAVLETYHKRLRQVVDGLLARANEIDQGHKYLPEPISSDTSKRFGKTCSELVTLTDSLQLIETQLRSGDVRQSRQTLLQCIRIAHHAARELESARSTGHPAP